MAHPPITRGADLAGVDLAGHDLRGADLRDACLRGARLRGADLSRADLTGADLRAVDARRARFTGADLSRADSSRARLMGCDFTRAVLDEAAVRHADLNGSRFDRASLRGCALAGSRITGARLTRADLTGARLTGARLAGSDLRGAVLRDALAVGARLTRCDMVGVDLRRCRAAGADLTAARLRYADLRGADLSGARLDDADFTRAHLDDADLSDVRARWCRFDGADMAQTDLRRADLTWSHLDRVRAPAVDLRGADLHRAWLVGALTGARLEGARCTATWLGGDLTGARLDRADLRGWIVVAATLHDLTAAEVRVDPLGVQALAAARVSGPLVVDLPRPLGGRLSYWPRDATTRVEVRDGLPWEGHGLALPVPGPRIRVEARSPREAAPRWTGDVGFDDAVGLRTPDPADTLARLDGALRRALLRFVGWGGRVYERAVRIDTLEPLAPRLTTALQIAVTLARPIAQPEPALMRRLPDEPRPVRHRLLARWMVAAGTPRLPHWDAVAGDIREGALRDLVTHGPASAWAVTCLARERLRLGPIVAEGADLAGVVLSGLRLEAARFGDACLAGAELEGLVATDIDLRGADLRSARMGRADLRRADLRGACLDGAQLVEADLRRADLRGADLTGADLRGADLRDARLDGCRAPYARFVDARLDRARFDGSQVPGARFTGARGERVFFDGAGLVRANFERARLQSISWVDCDLQRARFRRAHLTRARFTGARTRLAVFDEARLDRVLLRGCQLDGGLIAAQLTDVDLRDGQIAGELDRTVFDRVDLRGATVAPESLRRLTLRAVRIDLAGLAGLVAGRGEPVRPGALTGVDGRYHFVWAAEAGPQIRLWPRGADADPPDDESAVVDGGPAGPFAPIDAMHAALRRHFDRSAPDPGAAEPDRSALAWSTPGSVRIPWAPADLTLGGEGTLTAMRKALGAAEPQIGDGPFDRQVYIATADPAGLQARLDGELRAMLQRWIADGGTISGGTVHAPGPLAPEQVIPALRRGLAIADRLNAPLPDVPGALLRRAHDDPVPGVRAAALARWMGLWTPQRLPDDPQTLPPGAVEGALLLLLDDDRADRPRVVDWLADWGTEDAVPALAKLGGRWLTPRPLKQAVDRTIAAITRRVGGLRSGGLSMTGGLADGRVSPVDDE